MPIRTDNVVNVINDVWSFDCILSQAMNPFQKGLVPKEAVSWRWTHHRVKLYISDMLVRLLLYSQAPPTLYFKCSNGILLAETDAMLGIWGRRNWEEDRWLLEVPTRLRLSVNNGQHLHIALWYDFLLLANPRLRLHSHPEFENTVLNLLNRSARVSIAFPLSVEEAHKLLCN